MSERKHPRRPAMLDPALAEEILGSEDTAISSEVAHRTAQLIVGLDADSEYGEEISQRLIAVINTEGVDTVAELWSRSPATTLPGTLWRLYLIEQWWKRDRTTLEDRYQEGLEAPSRPGLDETQQADLGKTMRQIRELLLSRFDGSLPHLLMDVAVVLRTLAAGAAGAKWMDEDDDLAYEVSTRASALLATATEIEEAAQRAQNARLD